MAQCDFFPKTQVPGACITVTGTMPADTGPHRDLSNGTWKIFKFYWTFKTDRPTSINISLTCLPNVYHKANLCLLTPCNLKGHQSMLINLFIYLYRGWFHFCKARLQVQCIHMKSNDKIVFACSDLEKSLGAFCILYFIIGFYILKVCAIGSPKWWL